MYCLSSFLSLTSFPLHPMHILVPNNHPGCGASSLFILICVTVDLVKILPSYSVYTSSTQNFLIMLV